MNTPTLRFSEFSGYYVKTTLGKIGESIIGLTYSPSDISELGTIVLRSSNVQNDKINLKDLVKVSVNKISSNKLLKESDILLCSRNGSKSLIGKSALITKDLENETFGAFMTIYRSANNQYVYQFFKTSQFKKEVHSYLGATINQITSKTLNSIKINVPSEEEQNKIAAFLSLVDKRIELQEDKINKLEEYKKGMMQKIFSQEIRFKDANGEEYPEWNKFKLRELGKITTGKLNANAMVDDGEYRFYTCAKDFFRIDNYAFDTEALLISGNGANVGYIHYYKGKFNAYQRTYVIDKFRDNIFYIKFFLEKFLSKRINSEKKDGNTPYIVLSTLEEMDIKLPKLEEQEKISLLLLKIDKKVEKEKELCNKLINLKKVLLQQMFL